MRSPPAGTLQLLDLADDLIALDAAQPIDEDHAVEVIHLVLEPAREQGRALDGLLGPMPVEAAHRGFRGADHRRVEPGYAQAALLLELHAVARHEDGIDHLDETGTGPPAGDVDDEDAQRHANLGGRQTDAGR